MLSDSQKEASSLFDRLQSAQQEMDRTEIKAPVSGVVMALTVNTVGGVVQPGGHVLDIVPEGEPLIVEAMIQTHLIDQVRAGIDADLRFSAFNQSKTPVIVGKVITVSADRLSDPASHQPYYLARISVPPEQMKRLGSNHIQAGMPVEVIVKGEARTFMSYLLKTADGSACLLAEGALK
jgi:HlyD family type I secretion membrane fusion protein